MFKRKPRVIFCSREPLPALIALSCLQAMGAEMVEGQALALIDTPSQWPGRVWQNSVLPAVALTPVSSELLAWADLLITLDERPAIDVDQLPSQLRHRPWTLDGAASEEALIEALSKRVAGMLGGIRMMSRQ